MAREILIVDDEADIRMLITGVLADEGYETRDAADGHGAVEAVRDRMPSLVVLDIWLRDSVLDGLDVLKLIIRDYPNLPVVMISGHGTIEVAVKAIKLGAYDFIEKPFKADHMLLVVERAIEAARLRHENEELRLRAGSSSELLGQSSAMCHLKQAVTKVAPTGSRVLITGPAGVGKEIVARSLHELSRRAQGRFLVLNCATMHPERMESELFGSETGWDGMETCTRVGVFERAHGGTLLLDEVADMPLETQGKIVRVLQEQTFLRVGGDRRVEVDVRVLASTNQDLMTLIVSGQFREDLFYRLNVVPIRVPALRERREDIPELIDYFMAHAAQMAGLPPRRLSDDGTAALQAYDWPGNVRQLRNVVDWILIMAPGKPDEPVFASMLPADIGDIAPVITRPDAAREVMALPLREAREVFERQYLEAQISRFGGNISRTAGFVGMERSALHRKLRTLGIAPGERH
jgi:two-component system, NtrC family, nitrogen regulation response regulator NtrX